MSKCPVFGIVHILNEKYMLQWWIPHHAKKFDHVVVIDYGSTDGSVELIKQLRPDWTVVRSRNNNFRAGDVDAEVYDMERNILSKYPMSWVIALNVTEFVIGDTSKLPWKRFRLQYNIPCDFMVDMPNQEYTELDPNVPIVQQRTFGIPCVYTDRNKYDPHDNDVDANSQANNVVHTNRYMRSLHNYPMNYMDNSMYGLGRHFWGTPHNDIRILWYGYSPFTKGQVDRKCAIQNAIPEDDKRVGNGMQHLNLTEDVLLHRLRYYQGYAVNLEDQIRSLES